MSQRSSQRDDRVSEVDRVEILLALLLLQNMKGATVVDKVHQLNVAGFTNLEIADILQIKPDIVSDSLYRARRRTPASSKKVKSKRLSAKR